MLVLSRILTLAGGVSLPDVSNGLRVITSTEDIIEAGHTSGDGAHTSLVMGDSIMVGDSHMDVSGGHRHRVDRGRVNNSRGDGEDSGRGWGYRAEGRARGRSGTGLI